VHLERLVLILIIRAHLQVAHGWVIFVFVLVIVFAVPVGLVFLALVV
jgi:hypothetical protein